jgi:hypothetical protein
MTESTDQHLPSIDPRLRAELEAAVEGLVYSSEGDYPFEVFFLPGVPVDGLDAREFARLMGAGEEEPVRERGLDDFMARHTERSDPWDAQAQAIRPRYERLTELLRERLQGVRVFRYGRMHVQCYAVGGDGRGNLAGLHTVAVET